MSQASAIRADGWSMPTNIAYLGESEESEASRRSPGDVAHRVVANGMFRVMVLVGLGFGVFDTGRTR